MFAKYGLSVAILIVLFFSFLVSGGQSGRLSIKSPTILKGLQRRLFALDNSVGAQSSPGSSLTCPKNTISSCLINGTSSLTLPAGQSQTLSYQLSCTPTQVYVSWSAIPGLLISPSVVNGSQVVTINASEAVSGGVQASIWVEYCDNQGQHAVFQTLVYVPLYGCGQANCTANQWCFEDDAGTGNCMDYAALGQSCDGLAKCQPGLLCLAQNCTKPRMPCLYNPPSNCTLNVTSVTSFKPNGQNNTITVALPPTDPTCGPALFAEFSSNYTYGVQFYYQIQTSEVQVTLNDLIKGSGIVTFEFCDRNSRYLKQQLNFDFYSK